MIPLIPFLLAVLLVNAELSWAQEKTTQTILRTQIERLRQFNTLSIGTTRVTSTEVLADFYERRNFDPAWTSQHATKDLLRSIQESQKDGLNPHDYHLAELQRLHLRRQANPTPSPYQLANLDLLQTDALIRLSHHFLTGKVSPKGLDRNWNLNRKILDIDPVVALQTLIDSGQLHQAIQQFKPQQDTYRRLKAALAQYRLIESRGGWPVLPEGLSLKLGMTGARVLLLRDRLAITGDLSQTANRTSTLFDSTLEDAVKRFQHRHGLEVDGIVGRKTRVALNVPIARRINQLRVNLERSRWVLRDLPDTFIVVNIAGFKVYVIRDGKRVWETRAAVGSDYQKSPIFKANLKYLVFNPTWTVPRRISVEEFLPRIQQDPTYLQVNHINVIDRSGKVINPNTIDWLQHSGRYFPYTLRQDPGPNNALGKVKFMFPNPHQVFLHDTPQKALFRKPTRTFSHGCIWVEHPFKLAEQVLSHSARHSARWNEDAIQQAVASGKTQSVFLSNPLPVLLLYWTTEVDSDGMVHFLHDIYDRDQAVLQGLESAYGKKIVTH